MRLLFVSNLYPSQSEPIRGLPNARLMRQLATNHEARVLAARPRLFPPYGDGVHRQADTPLAEDAALAPRVVHVPYAPKIGSLANHFLYARGMRRAFAAAVAGARPDAVLVGWLFPDTCGILRLARHHKLPVFGIAQGSDAHQYLDLPWRRRVILDGCAQATGIIARSRALAERLARAGVPTGKLRTIYNGVETDFFRPGEPEEARRELGFPLEANVLLYVGNLLPIKNPGLLLDAFARLDGSPELVYVGDGELRQGLQRQAQTLGVADRVRLAGTQPPGQVVRHMQAADLLVVPSRDEGLPNVIREAFACGLPVVATDVGGIREIVCGEWLGSLVPSENPAALAAAIAGRLAQPPAAARIRQHAEGFSWARCGAECSGFVRERIDG